jgi:hypothetical protein
VRAGRKAQELVAHDTEVTYLANNERQLAIERLLIWFGEALKSIRLRESFNPSAANSRAEADTQARRGTQKISKWTQDDFDSM